MLARRVFIFLLVCALVLFCPACACAPDRWTLGTERGWDTHTGRPTEQKVTATLSGPIPPFFHD